MISAINSSQPELQQPELVGPGIWRFRLGSPEEITPTSTRHFQSATLGLAALPAVAECPLHVTGSESSRGFQVRLPLERPEQLYGLGLQLLSFQQRGLKKTLRVNADPLMDSGDSHAPVPFYVSTGGYGVLIDTARYATFYLGNQTRREDQRPASLGESDGAAIGAEALPVAYAVKATANEVVVDIPVAQGVDVYVFAGPAIRDAVQRYNLFSGGGALPPRWGLGFWYRCKTDFTQDGVLQMAAELRERRIPCDVLGLEPGWQTQAYSCSFVWSEPFPNPGAMVTQLQADNFQVNLWEHAFTHPDSPIYEALETRSGDYTVWNGLVPDFLTPEARRIFAVLHEQEHISLGISGYKLDECDNSDYTGSWSFPDLSRFPSGADGEQFHSLLGLRYQDTILSTFEARQQPTYGLVRNSHALAAPYPFVLYSDLYDHKSFIHGIAQSSFTGLLWTPEVRHATHEADLIRRLQSVVFSPLSMLNAWYLSNPPWKQTQTEANNAGEFVSGWEHTEATCREIIQWRMQFLPYLHAAFVQYHRTGLPPFRALVMDYPDDTEVHTISNQYMMGEALLVAPVVAGQDQHSLYLPEGDWFDYWRGERVSGKQWIERAVPLEQIPLFVKSGTILPLAQSTLHTNDPESWHLTLKIYGETSRPTVLFSEPDPATHNMTETKFEVAPDSKRIVISHSQETGQPKYTVKESIFVG